MPSRRTIVVTVAAMLSASSAAAQSDLTPRTAAALVGGFGSTTSMTGIAVGGSILFDATKQLSFEAQGTYLDRGAGRDALSVNGSVVANVLPASRRVVPYGAVGVGVYRAWFNLDNPRLRNQMQVPSGSMRDVSGRVSDFYARRLGMMRVPADGVLGTRHFTDPAMTLGGGVRFNVNERIMVRPDVRALIVAAEGAVHTMAIFGLHAAYRF